MPRAPRGASLKRNCVFTGTYSRRMPGALWCPHGGVLFLMSEVTLYYKFLMSEVTLYYRYRACTDLRNYHRTRVGKVMLGWSAYRKALAVFDSGGYQSLNYVHTHSTRSPGYEAETVNIYFNHRGGYLLIARPA